MSAARGRIRTAGLDFLAAMTACKRGARVRRRSWPQDTGAVVAVTTRAGWKESIGRREPFAFVHRGTSIWTADRGAAFREVCSAADLDGMAHVGTIDEVAVMARLEFAETFLPLKSDVLAKDWMIVEVPKAPKKRVGRR